MARIWMRDWHDPYRFGGERSHGQSNELLNAADASRDAHYIARTQATAAAAEEGVPEERSEAAQKYQRLAFQLQEQADEMEYLSKKDVPEHLKAAETRVTEAAPDAEVTWGPTWRSLNAQMTRGEELDWQMTAKSGDEAVLFTELHSREYDREVTGYLTSRVTLKENGTVDELEESEKFEADQIVQAQSSAAEMAQRLPEAEKPATQQRAVEREVIEHTYQDPITETTTTETGPEVN